jgi:ribosome biogenesis GTPase / thiamine phosphate phosphatase
MQSASHDYPSSLESSIVSGVVTAIQANYYHVQLDHSARFKSEPNPTQAVTSPLSQPMLLCTRRARLKKIGQQVMVGDRVIIAEPDWHGGRGAITQVLDRESQLDRPSIANVDQILLVFALAEPVLEPYQLSRFLVKAESTGLPICLCLSKQDLMSQQHVHDWQQRLHDWGYSAIAISTRTHNGLPELQARLHQKITVVAGPSGVGKSSLINHFIPAANAKVNAISGKLERGRHTTRHVELFPLAQGGLLADTPGFNQPDLTCMPGQLADYFPEIQQRLKQQPCQFKDCTHRDEPNCAVRGNWERYEHYLNFMDIVQLSTVKQLAAKESTVKLKSKSDGQSQYEPRLAAKKYRRTSRRMQHQALQLFTQCSDDLL